MSSNKKKSTANDNIPTTHTETSKARLLCKAMLMLKMNFEATSDPNTFVHGLYTCTLSYDQPIFSGFSDPRLLTLEWELAGYIAKTKQDPEALVQLEEELASFISSRENNRKRKSDSDSDSAKSFDSYNNYYC